jgi:NAD(P)-dependent dehydrogenase (short-subunit alcohol dehydrogenase family)
VYLSSHSVPDPWPGLGAYAASKAGLETLVRAWAGEEPAVRFQTYVVGPTMTAFADGWDDDLTAELMPQWQAAGLLDVTQVRTAEAVAEEVVAVLNGGDDHFHDRRTRSLS